ncbi:hypothetical protein F441_15679 [Phytophthora nicotianae CJ01A1]|uniref:Uncharacterized protein n=4 Tax=Phytophthora nicotianae TaxID=4792 RepID=V9EK30_PHYNI|nr:hypothetical protein F443_15846 [Phytophthora nicotianae P1569]ETO67172.1 hypothetical protein F444_15826 [Phytophthora nicotianae P1976]ETP08354.1 hypothetical protein F441_15679 [Phytophthora nicotianae CJ01A1]ETP36406.1 hypothetical protein F442_15687 [Phytophthora nicotianae P10297]
MKKATAARAVTYLSQLPTNVEDCKMQSATVIP